VPPEPAARTDDAVTAHESGERDPSTEVAGRLPVTDRPSWPILLRPFFSCSRESRGRPSAGRPAAVRRLGVVLQSSRPLGATVRECVTGPRRMEDDEVWALLEGAELVDDVRGMPERLHAPVGGHGLALSGGQRQRRMSTVRDADRIVVVAAGGIAEEGTQRGCSRPAVTSLTLPGGRRSDMPTDPRAGSARLLSAFAREPGRSLLARVETPSAERKSGVAADEPRHAASLRLVGVSTDAPRYPLAAHALQHTVRNSRIPLGADGLDVRIAHKTGGLAGVANDAAMLECDGGTLWLAFLTEKHHDTLVSGYEMGICTRGLLQAWGLAVRHSRSLA
jgi:hypothetical protein